MAFVVPSDATGSTGSPAHRGCCDAINLRTSAASTAGWSACSRRAGNGAAPLGGRRGSRPDVASSPRSSSEVSPMKPNLLAVAAGVAGAFLLGRVGQAGDDGGKTVAAKKYRTAFAESVCDWIHGGGTPVHGLFLPGAKVAAFLEYRWDFQGPGGAFRERPTLHARGAEKADEASPEKEGAQP